MVKPRAARFNKLFPAVYADDHQVLLIEKLFFDLFLAAQVDVVRYIMLNAAYRFLNLRVAFYRAIRIQNRYLRTRVAYQLLRKFYQERI